VLTVIECAGIVPEAVPVVLIAAVTKVIVLMDPSRSTFSPPVRVATIPAALEVIMPLAIVTVTGALPSLPTGPSASLMPAVSLAIAVEPRLIVSTPPA